jgi:predicted  nucleic acid-binding Zn-ribbon protein
MQRNYTFEKTTVDGIEYVIANPTGNGEMVRMEAEWTEGQDVEGKWEDAVRAIIGGDLLGDMNLDGGDGRIDKQDAVETLAAADQGGEPVVASQRQADALIEYFAEEDILRLEGNQVVLLQDPRNEDISGRAALNWAAGIDACIEKIEETRDRVKRAKEKLEQKKEDLDTGPSGIEERIQETGQKLRSLGDGPGVPSDASELSESETKRYRQLKKEFITHKKMKDVESTNLLETVAEGTAKLGNQMNMLESAKEALSKKEGEIRVRAIQQREFPDDAKNIVDNMSNIATQLAGVGNVDEAVENTSDEDFANMVEDEVLDLDVGEDVEQLTEAEADEESRTNSTFNE